MDRCVRVTYGIAVKQALFVDRLHCYVIHNRVVLDAHTVNWVFGKSLDVFVVSHRVIDARDVLRVRESERFERREYLIFRGDGITEEHEKTDQDVTMSL